jgi:hypothetical protein
MDIVPKYLGENSPIFQLTIDGVMVCPHLHLNCQLLLVLGDEILWALYLVDVPMVAIIGLDSLVFFS